MSMTYYRISITLQQNFIIWILNEGMVWYLKSVSQLFQPPYQLVRANLIINLCKDIYDIYLDNIFIFPVMWIRIWIHLKCWIRIRIHSSAFFPT